MDQNKKIATIVILPFDANMRPIWKESKPIAVPFNLKVFKLMTEIEVLTRHAHIILGKIVYKRLPTINPILDLSMNEISYALPVVEVPDPSVVGEQLDIDVKGRPMFKVIQGGKSDGKSAA